MGLDMYVFATTTVLAQPVDFAEPPAETLEKIFEWRKHPNLHGWMEQLYLSKGGQDKEFNLSPVVLDIEDISRLELSVTSDRLPFTEGCFFGESCASDRDDDLAFVEAARIAIAAGKAIFYIAWW